MDVTPEQFVDALLSDEVYEQPSDTVKPEELVIELPKWYDEEQFNRGRKFYWSHCFAFSTSMLLGLVAVFSVPSILRILVSTRRANSVFTSYRRYLSTLLHTISWFEHPLKPGSISWKSLYTVRSRHLRAGLASRLKNLGTVNQRDIALTQFGFIGFSLVQSDKLGIRQLQSGDWDAYNHFWRVIGHMIGLDDRYNICRSTAEETREVCRILLERVFTPCLENVPEHFEHSARVMLDGMWSVNPTLEENSTLYFTRYLANVPGYIYTESDRVEFQKRLRQALKGRSLDEGVSSRSLIGKCAVSGLPDVPPKQLYLRDYDCLETAPTYQQLSFKSKFKLNSAAVAIAFYNTYLGRLYFNLNFLWSLVLMRYFPYLAFFRFGFRASYPKLFQEDPTDDSVPLPNSEYYKPQPPSTWYEDVWAVIW